MDVAVGNSCSTLGRTDTSEYTILVETVFVRKSNTTQAKLIRRNAVWIVAKLEISVRSHGMRSIVDDGNKPNLAMAPIYSIDDVEHEHDNGKCFRTFSILV